MSSNWPTVKIDDIKIDRNGAIAIGPFGSRMKSDCYVSSGVPVIRGNNLGVGLEFRNEFVFITEEKADELGSCNVYKGDLVFPHRGSIGEVGIVEKEQRYVLSTSLMKLTCDPKKACSKFIYYFFKSNKGKYELLKNASQVGTPGIGQPLTSLRSIEVPLPPLNIQKSIARILGSLDKKIQLNQKINQTLEQIAQAIFKSWFVDFEPVKAKIAARKRWLATQPGNEAASPVCYAGELGDPAAGEDLETAMNLAAMQAIPGKNREELTRLQSEQPDQYSELLATAELFPSVMQDSELGEVPQGWEVKQLSELIQLIGGGTPKKSESSYWGGNIFWFSIKDIPSEGDIWVIDTEDKITQAGLDGSSTKLLPIGTTIITARGTVGKLALTGVTTAMNQSCYGVSATDGSGPYLNYLRLKAAVEMLKRNTHGAVFDTITRKTFDTVIQVSAPQGVKNRFEQLISPIFMSIQSNLENTKTLSGIRDTLLPKLLSGELTLPDTETQEPELPKVANV